MRSAKKTHREGNGWGAFMYCVRLLLVFIFHNGVARGECPENDKFYDNQGLPDNAPLTCLRRWSLLQLLVRRRSHGGVWKSIIRQGCLLYALQWTIFFCDHMPESSALLCALLFLSCRSVAAMQQGDFIRARERIFEANRQIYKAVSWVS